MTDVTRSETEADARERLAKAVEIFDGTDEEARELSDQVLLAMGYGYGEPTRVFGGFWLDPDGTAIKLEYRPHPLRSVDDALKMLPEGWVFHFVENHLGHFTCRLSYSGGGTAHVLARGKTIQAAITAAALRAGG